MTPFDDAIVRRAAAMVELGRHRDAKDLLVGAGVPEVGPARAAFVLGQAYLGLHWPTKAVGAIDAGLRRAPEHEWGLRVRSHALVAAGRTEEAVATARTAVSRRPTSPPALVTLAEALLADRQLPAAETAIGAAIELDPTSAGYHDCAGRIAIAQRNRQEARRHFLDALALDPDHAPARNNLGVVDLQQRRFRQARGNFVGATRIDPRSLAASNVGRVERATRQRRLALAAVPVLAVLLVLVPGAVIVVIAGIFAISRRVFVRTSPPRRPPGPWASLAFLLLAMVGVVVVIAGIAVLLAVDPQTVPGQVGLVVGITGGYYGAVAIYDAVGRRYR